MASKHYETFYFDSDGNEYDISILETYFEKNNKLGQYTNHIFCSECKQAKLSFVQKTNKKRAFLRRLSSTNHKINCSYNYEYLKKKEISSFFEPDEMTKEQVDDKLNAMMRALFRSPIIGIPKNSYNIDTQVETETPFVFENNDTGIKIKRTIRRRKLEGWIDSDNLEEEQLYLLYGVVKLEKDERTSQKGNDFHYLKIKVKNKNEEWKSRVSIYRANEIDEVDIEKVYEFVMIGIVKFNEVDNGKKYLNIQPAIRNGAVQVKYKER